jgi:dienelactone hydrolase
VDRQGARDEQELYEEDLTASLPHREAQWRELEAYVEALGAEAEAREPYAADFTGERGYLGSIEPLRELLRARIGYPPPGVGAAGETRMELVGEDRVARYYRCWVEVSGRGAVRARALQVYGLYLVPPGLSAPAPLVIAQHGGGGTPETALFQGAANYHDMVRGAAARGYVVFAPHLIFNPFSDQEAGSSLPAGVRSRLDARLRLLGTSLTAVEVGKISRALDALLTRPEVDAARVAMIGLSYGGYYTLHTAALEPRINVAVSSCYFNDQSRRMPLAQPDAWSDMRFLGTVSDLADPELAALVCPRPLQVQVGKDDAMFPVDHALRMAERAAAYYERLGVPERFEFVPFDGGHEWWGEAAWPFLESRL